MARLPNATRQPLLRLNMQAQFMSKGKLNPNDATSPDNTFASSCKSDAAALLADLQQRLDSGVDPETLGFADESESDLFKDQLKTVRHLPSPPASLTTKPIWPCSRHCPLSFCPTPLSHPRLPQTRDTLLTLCVARAVCLSSSS